MDSIFQDLRFALRGLANAPGFTAAVVLTLALGIGANTAMFSLINSLLLRDLPVRDPERLIVVRRENAGGQAFSYPAWDHLRRQRQFFDGSFAYGFSRFNLAQGGESDSVEGMWVSGEFFSTLGVSASLGRTITDVDDQRGGGASGAVAVISHRFWQQRFGGAADVTGRTLVIERMPFTIIGVTPSRFFGPNVGRSFDIAVPVGTEPLLRGRDSRLDLRNFAWLTVMARLKADMSLDAATAALQSIQPQLREATMPRYPGARESYLKDPFVAGAAGGTRSGGQYREPLFIMMATAIIILLIACANIANLLLARATARRHELSVRLAMGASRWRLSRQWLVESLLLSATGALLGMFLAEWGGQLLLHEMSTPAATAFLELRPDWRVLAFTTAVAMTVAMLFGMAPAIRTSKLTAVEALKSYSRGSEERRGRFGSVLVVMQVALSLMLVIAAGLFVRTFTTLAAVDLGFEQGRVLLVNVNTAPARIEPSRRLEVLERIQRDVRLIPDVRAAALSVITPVSGNGLGNRVEVIGVPALSDNQLESSTNFVSPSWFSTYRIQLLAGRDFTDRDRLGTPDVAIVNQAFARKFLNGANPVGRFVREVYAGRAATAPQREIVGLVADATYSSLREPPPPTVYKPMTQLAPADSLLGFVSLSVAAASGSPAALAPRVVAAITNINPNLSLTSRALASQVEGSLSRERLLAMLSGFFGTLALLLSAIGLYGLTSYGVSRRRGEIGIRLALGAAPNTVIVTVLRQVAILVSVGILAGTLLSWWMARFVAPALLYGLTPRDPLTIAGAALVLLAVGALAGWLPARRAARIDPAQVLREA